MSQRIPPSFIQDILARTDIVELIQSRTSLTKRGDNYLARCPFHEEKTPSFNVSQRKQFYYCFGCQASGNAIGFLMAYDHLPFREAVTQLADALGISLPTQGHPEAVQEYDILHQTLDNASRYYQMTLRKHSSAIDYLKSRGLTGATAKSFGLGYAPSGWRSLQQYIGTDPAQQNALHTTGLVIRKESTQSYDRFRERIMFPIRNIQGKIIGFGGRTIGKGDPKYLNSPETPVFHKGAELYGLYEVKQHAHSFDTLLVVEGYMDVIALHQHQIYNAVATLGTAVTVHQIRKLLRYSNRLVFCFDGDRAGRNAAWKALTLSLPLLREGIHIDFLFLPEQEDPDSWVRKIGGEAFHQQVQQALPLSEVFFKELHTQFPVGSSAGKAQFGHQAAQYLNTMPPGLFREVMYQQLAQELQMDATALSKLLQPGPVKAATQRRPAPLPPTHQVLPPIHLAISLLLHQPALAALVMPEADWIQDLDVKDKQLFLYIANSLQQSPELTTGELLSRTEEQQEQQLIAALAARKLSITHEGLTAEFQGTMASLEQMAIDQTIAKLIEKAKKSQLNLEEKGKLQNLLTKLKKYSAER